MRRSGSLAVFVTSHGFGHLNRTAAVLNRIPEDVPIVVRCASDLFDHWRDRLGRPARYVPYVSDAGTAHPPGQSADVDGPASLERAAAVHDNALQSLDDLCDALRSERAAAVVCDASAVPLVAAKRLGIPGFLLSNFTWVEILRPHAEELGGRWPAFVDRLQAAYDHATAILRINPALAMAGRAPAIDVGMVTNAGCDRQAELRRTLGLLGQEKLIYLYLGRYGSDDFGWRRLEPLSKRGLHFVGFQEGTSSRPVSNAPTVPPESWTGADLAASCDVVVAKAGYGTICEAIVAGTPMIYPPRSGFAEHEALEDALTAWGGGLRVPKADFERLRIEPFIEQALELRPGPPPFPTDGSERVAAFLTALSRGEAELDQALSRLSQR